MKALLPFLLCLLSLPAVSQEKGPADACEQKAQTQADLNKCSSDRLAREDAKLNRVYQELLAKVKNDSVATAKIRSAQRAWIVFRDAQMRSLFPAEDKQARYGSSYGMCAAVAQAQLTSERTQMLEGMLHPNEGDVCSH